MSYNHENNCVQTLHAVVSVITVLCEYLMDLLKYTTNVYNIIFVHNNYGVHIYFHVHGYNYQSIGSHPMWVGITRPTKTYVYI